MAHRRYHLGELPLPRRAVGIVLRAFHRIAALSMSSSKKIGRALPQ
jgi:hypothetical protein